MGLAYNLDATENPYIKQGLSKYFVTFPQELQEAKVNFSLAPTNNTTWNYNDAMQGEKTFAEMFPSWNPENTGVSFFDQQGTNILNSNGWTTRWCGRPGAPNDFSSAIDYNPLLAYPPNGIAKEGMGKKQWAQGIFPTGQFIIRDIVFVNGHYCMVGAYQATFLDLYGVGSHGVAWDGFLMIYRGYSDNVFVPFGKDGITSPNLDAASGIGILPMRMPYNLGPDTDPAVVEEMSDVGLYCVDIWRQTPYDGNVAQPGGGDPLEAYNIQLILGGTQAVADSIQLGMTYANIDRVAYGMWGVFGSASYPDSYTGQVGPIAARNTNTANYVDDGGNASILQYDTYARQTTVLSWGTSQALPNNWTSNGNTMNLEKTSFGDENSILYPASSGQNHTTGCGFTTQCSFLDPAGMWYKSSPNSIFNQESIYYNIPAAQIGGCSGEVWGVWSWGFPPVKIREELVVDNTLYRVENWEGPRAVDLAAYVAIGANERGGQGGLWNYEVMDTSKVQPSGSVYPACSYTGAFTEQGIDVRASTWNYYPKCFYDIQAYSSHTKVIGGTETSVFSPAWFVGDAWVGTDDPSVASPQAKTYPMVMVAQWDSFYVNTMDCNGVVMQTEPDGLPSGSATVDNIAACNSVGMPPYMMMTCGGASFKGAGAGGSGSIRVDSLIQASIKNDGGGANWNNLAGAYMAFCTVPFEEIGYDDAATASPSGKPPLIYFYMNNITYLNGNVGTGIFYVDEFPFEEIYLVQGLLFNGQYKAGTDDEVPIQMPNKFTAKIQQFRTFTTQEEENSKSLADYPVGGGYTTYGQVVPIYPFIENQDTAKVINSRTNEYVGVKGNYPRLGFEPINDQFDASADRLAQMGDFSGEAMGAMGWRTVNGVNRFPVVLLFDSGGGWVKSPYLDPSEPSYNALFEYSNSLQNRGDTFNSKILIDKDSDTRIALGCCWDNDRDQWLFLFGNYTSVAADQSTGVVSVKSTFTSTPAFGDAYLDQTKNFMDKDLITGDPVEFNNMMWMSFPMTNNLDGLVMFGMTTLQPKAVAGAYENEGVLGDVSKAPNEVWGAFDLEEPDTERTFPPYLAPTAEVVIANGCGIFALTTGTTTVVSPAAASDPTEIAYYPTLMSWWNLNGSTGREAYVWVDYILFDGADAVIATKLRERGMKVTIDSVEWFKRKIINKGDLNIKQEEIEMWMREQQDEFQQMMRDAERMGRVRKKKKQVSAFGLDMIDSINTDFEDNEVQEFMKDYIPKSRPPTPEEQMIERQQKGGYSPEANSYFDEVFE